MRKRKRVATRKVKKCTKPKRENRDLTSKGTSLDVKSIAITVICEKTFHIFIDFSTALDWSLVEQLISKI
ncbi:MAG: hypothetical protein GY730_05550 [bacterium]|nr:hypothetical protein [bacterium]